MQFSDRVYGEFEISEPVILELIQCAAMHRLKGIDQAGYFEAHFPNTTHTRFEHSLGVFYILKRFNAPLEEQIAGLIHDVSHSAFSHCIDYVLRVGSEKEQSHQDNVFANFVKNTEIPAILQKHGFNLEYILDDKNFPLKEKELPDLCADRIDYSLRSAFMYGEITSQEVEYFLSNLSTRDGDWIFNSFESAKKYAELFLKVNILYYAGLPSAVMFRTVGDYLRHALEKNYISEKDLYTTDKDVLQKIEPFLAGDEELCRIFARMNNHVPYKTDPQNYDVEVFCKSRIIDPWCMHKSQRKRVSDIHPFWKKVLEQESQPKQYFIKFKE